MSDKSDSTPVGGRSPGCLRPDWPAPASVHALTTCRFGGCSQGPWHSFNLAMHTGDDPSAVESNRKLLQEHFGLPSQPVWLEQVHGRRIVGLKETGDGAAGPELRADGSWSRTAGVVCAVMTADCLPVLMCDISGSCVGVVHAGWKGLHNGIIPAAVDAFAVPSEELMAWLGPAIGPENYEIGRDVYDAFVHQSDEYRPAFRATREGHWLLDVYEIARIQLRRSGVGAIYGGTECTYSNADAYYSYRRDGQCGRMASLIWLDTASSRPE